MNAIHVKRSHFEAIWSDLLRKAQLAEFSHARLAAGDDSGYAGWEPGLIDMTKTGDACIEIREAIACKS